MTESLNELFKRVYRQPGVNCEGSGVPLAELIKQGKMLCSVCGGKLSMDVEHVCRAHPNDEEAKHDCE